MLDSTSDPTRFLSILSSSSSIVPFSTLMERLENGLPDIGSGVGDRDEFVDLLFFLGIFLLVSFLSWLLLQLLEFRCLHRR